MENIKNPFDLQSYQKKYKHIKRVVITGMTDLIRCMSQNISITESSLHFKIHFGRSEQEIYQSEKKSISNNYYWDYVTHRNEDKTIAQQTEMCLALFLTHNPTGQVTDLLTFRINLGHLKYLDTDLQIRHLIPIASLILQIKKIYFYVRDFHLDSNVAYTMIDTNIDNAQVLVSAESTVNSYTSDVLRRMWDMAEDLNAKKEVIESYKTKYKTKSSKIDELVKCHSESLNKEAVNFTVINPLRQKLADLKAITLQLRNTINEGNRIQKADEALFDDVANPKPTSNPESIVEKPVPRKSTSQLEGKRYKFVYKLKRFVKSLEEDKNSNQNLANISHLLFVISKIFDIDLPYQILPRNMSSAIEFQFPPAGSQPQTVCLNSKEDSKCKQYIELLEQDAKQILHTFKIKVKGDLNLPVHVSELVNHCCGGTLTDADSEKPRFIRRIDKDPKDQTISESGGTGYGLMQSSRKQAVVLKTSENSSNISNSAERKAKKLKLNMKLDEIIEIFKTE